MTIERALEHLKAEKKVEALEVLLEVWRSTRSPAVADVIDLVSEDVTRTLPPIEGKTRKQFQEAWLDVAGEGRASDLGRLLATFTREPCPQVAERLERLEAREHDPRIAQALVAMIGACPCTSTPNFPMWTRLFKLLQATGDVRMRGPLEAKLGAKRPIGSFYEVLYPRLEKALAALKEPAPLPAAEQKTVTRLKERAQALLAAPAKAGASTPAASAGASAKKRGSEEELLAMVYEDPAADAPRLVYGDWLLERNDPRGELLTIQFKRVNGGVTKVEERRERALLKEHGRKWLGPLEPVVARKDVTFERGFLSACTLAFKTKRQLEALIGHPAWGTVRELTDPPFELCVQPVMRSLRCVRGIAPDDAARLAEHASPLAIEEIELSVDEVAPSEKAAISRARSLPELRRVTIRLPSIEAGAPPAVRPAEHAWLFEGELGRRLEHLGVIGFASHTVFKEPRPELAAWLAEAKPRKSLRSFWFDLQLHWQFRLTRPDARSKWSLTLEAFQGKSIGTLEPALRGIAPGTFARIELPTECTDAARKLLAPLGPLAG